MTSSAFAPRHEQTSGLQLSRLSERTSRERPDRANSRFRDRQKRACPDPKPEPLRIVRRVSERQSDSRRLSGRRAGARVETAASRRKQCSPASHSSSRSLPGWTTRSRPRRRGNCACSETKRACSHARCRATLGRHSFDHVQFGRVEPGVSPAATASSSFEGPRSSSGQAVVASLAKR